MHIILFVKMFENMIIQTLSIALGSVNPGECNTDSWPDKQHKTRRDQPALAPVAGPL
jgi:hypothetical protein